VYRYGVKVGDRVEIAMRNMPEWIIASAAIVSIRGISVSLNAWRTADAPDDAI
jgi:long-chain acyl-CoA synthetase